jgi:hypothetical protein
MTFTPVYIIPANWGCWCHGKTRSRQHLVAEEDRLKLRYREIRVVREVFVQPRGSAGDRFRSGKNASRSSTTRLNNDQTAERNEERMVSGERLNNVGSTNGRPRCLVMPKKHGTAKATSGR